MSKFIISGFSDEIDARLSVQMDELDKLDIHYIEVRGVDDKNIAQHSHEEVRAIKKRLKARGFKISAVGSPIGKIKIADDFAPHLTAFQHVLETAKILETPYIRMFSFFLPASEAPAKYRDEVLRRWSGFIAAAKGSGIRLLHENEKGIYGDNAERCLDLVESLGSDNLRLIFDPANFIQCGVESYPHAYQMLKAHVVYLHIKDALRESGAVRPAGYGDGRVREILADLKARGFEGFLSLEPHLGKFKGFAELEPNSPANNLPDGVLKMFAIAAEALRKLLAEI